MITARKRMGVLKPRACALRRQWLKEYDPVATKNIINQKPLAFELYFSIS